MTNSPKRHVPLSRALPLVILAGLVAVGLTACGGDDGPAGPDGDVSQAQAEKVAVAVNTAAGQAFGAAAQQSGSTSLLSAALAPAASTGPGARAATLDWSFDSSADCPQGGMASVDGDGTIETNEDASSISWDWSSQVGYDGCGVETEDAVFTLTTSSPVQFTGSGQLTSDDAGGGTGSFDWSVSGTVQWDEQGGASDTCDFDLAAGLDIESTGSSASSTGSVSGSVCGRTVERSWSGTIDLGSGGG